MTILVFGNVICAHVLVDKKFQTWTNHSIVLFADTTFVLLVSKDILDGLVCDVYM